MLEELCSRIDARTRATNDLFAYIQDFHKNVHISFEINSATCKSINSDVTAASLGGRGEEVG